MKYIELAKKIDLGTDLSQQQIKQMVLDRMQRKFQLSNLTELKDGFQVSAKTGGKDSLIKNARCDLEVAVIKRQNTAKISVFGTSQISFSLVVWYVLLFVIVLLVGLLPGSIETGGDKSGALDVLVFLIFGICSLVDIERKLNAGEKEMTSLLESIAVEIG